MGAVSETSNDAMDDGNCPITVQEVTELLHARHVIITGGKTQDGYPIITFPDNGCFCNLSDDDYKKLLIYLTSIPSTNCRLQEADLGFVLIIDRRNDTWNGVKAVLLKIGGYFPGLIQAVYVIKPASFLQKAISEVRSKLFKEDFKFNLIVCHSVEELHEHVDIKQLTKDLGGCISYDHNEWIVQRADVENFSRKTREISQNLRTFTSRLQETELPNDAKCTKEILRVLQKEYDDLKNDLHNASNKGEETLKMLKHPCTRSPTAISSCSSSADICPDSKLINVTAIERLLVQLEETERQFDNFWHSHEDKLQQCLELRRFEHEFRELQTNLDASLKQLTEMTEMGDSVARVDVLLKEFRDFCDDCEEDLDKAKRLQRIGEQLIASKHYAVDSIQPKCVELQRFCDDFNERLSRRREALLKYRDLQERVECANRWCTRGVDLLAGQQLERCTSPEFARSALEEVDTFLQTSTEFKLDNPKEFRNYFKDMITPETNALVQQVLKRIEDVQTMCEKKKASLQKLAAPPSRPIQPVVPEPAIPLTSCPSTTTSGSSSSTSPNLSSVVSSANGSNKISSPGSLELSDDAFDFDGGIQAPRKYARKARTLHKVFKKSSS